MIQNKVQIHLPKLFEWQQEFVDNDSKRKFLIIARQNGKSFVLTYCTARHAIYEKGNIMYIAPVFDQVKEPFSQLIEMLGPLVADSNLNKFIRLVNGNIIHFKSGDKPSTLRGKSISLLICDEFCFIKEASWVAVEPTTIAQPNMKIILASTPNSHNFAWELYTSIKNNDIPGWWLYHRMDNPSPLISREELELRKASKNKAVYDQEHCAMFCSPSIAHFPQKYFENIWVDEMPPKDQRQGSVICIDPAKGKNPLKGDYTAVLYIAKAHGTYYVSSILERTPYEEVSDKVRALIESYGPPDYVSCEINSMQWLVADYLKRDFKDIPLIEIHNKQDKDIRISRLGKYFEQNRFKFIDQAHNRRGVGQIMDYPTPTANDDFPDALEQGERVFNELGL